MDELIKAGLTLAGGKVLEVGADFLKRIVGPKGDDIGKEWAKQKTERIFTVASKANELVMDLPLHQPPDRVLVPLLNGAGNEDDPELQLKWAALLANAATTTNVNRVLPAFVEILGQLTPLQAAILDWLYKVSHTPIGDDDDYYFTSVNHVLVLEQFQLTFQDYALLLSDLHRLRLIDGERYFHVVDQPSQSRFPTATSVSRYDHVTITALGDGFIRACTPPLCGAESA